MPQAKTQNKPTLQSERIKVLCPNCAVRLCDRRMAPEGWHLHIRYSNKGKITQVFAKEIIMQCRECTIWHAITADEGITESNDGRSIQGAGVHA